jgi:hypothetical protein
MGMEARNRVGTKLSYRPASLCSRYDNPIPTRFPAPIDCSKITALILEYINVKSCTCMVNCNVILVRAAIKNTTKVEAPFGGRNGGSQRSYRKKANLNLYHSYLLKIKNQNVLGIEMYQNKKNYFKTHKVQNNRGQIQSP